jgi:hypothetical protein
MFGIETIFDSIPQFLIVCLIVAVAEAVYVLLGFGAGLIAVGTMALLLPELKDAVGRPWYPAGYLVVAVG